MQKQVSEPFCTAQLDLQRVQQLFIIVVIVIIIIIINVRFLLNTTSSQLEHW